ncbi:hypothetical protein SBA5_70137 [Candidatus Sulfotelmatomonas gaucii]|uniref:Uncharacterized protein n=1 Tax=Candidatus Sulfuritelmatomonas gaucii TaxID=2043161 RepID=A0A2N9M0U7_9BACT|nr:hypothetical protein SBA5_70137 [Candidatus Sulfotelmatomonas gaucii]
MTTASVIEAVELLKDEKSLSGSTAVSNLLEKAARVGKGRAQTGRESNSGVAR